MNYDKNIIGIVGFIGSGKDTVARILEHRYNYKRESFASSVKDVLASVFLWDRQLLEGHTDASRAWRETVDVWWAKRLDIPNFTPRYGMTHIATEIFRNRFHPDIWIASLERKLLNKDFDVVISDCRFINEIESLRQIGAKIVWVRRDPLPNWHSQAIEILKISDEKLQKLELDKIGVHTSETDWLKSSVDYVISNNGSISDLEKSVKIMMPDLLKY